MGKCKFSEKWTDELEFKPWQRAVAGNYWQAYCSFCKKTISIILMGINAVRPLMQSASHTSTTCREEQLSISNLFAARVPSTPQPSPTVSQASTSSTASTAGPGDLRTVMGATPTPAEVLWCLDTVAKHQSLNSNEGISEMFQAMFPDSEIAKSFTCGKDQAGYVIRFGLAPFFKKELVDRINKAGPFVLMFDESLNKSNKKTTTRHPCAVLGRRMCSVQILWIAVSGTWESWWSIASNQSKLIYMK